MKKEKAEEGLHLVRSGRQKRIQVLIGAVLILLGLICVLPFWYIVCQSLSSNSAISAGKVGLWPVDFTIDAYVYLLQRTPFWRSLGVTIARVVLGLPISLAVMVTAAYPLSRGDRFKGRSVYVWIFFFTMLFNGGMIPTYLVVKELGLLNTIWALVLPCACNVYNMLLLLSFFRQLPIEMEESAALDGASSWKILWDIFIPVSKPVLATVTLFTLVQHWNMWFDGLIYMKADNYPLQTYLRTIIINFNFANLSVSEIQRLATLSEDGLKAAQMFIGAIPILLVYPFLQKYFVSGLTLGSVKG